LKVIPKGSESESSEYADSDSEGGGKKAKGKTTIANMEARSRAMDAEAAREAELDIQELQDAVAAGEVESDNFDDDDPGGDEGGNEGEPSEPVRILTPEERETEKKAGGPDVLTVQRRLRHCTRVLENFKKLWNGRCGVCVLCADSGR